MTNFLPAPNPAPPRCTPAGFTADTRQYVSIFLTTPGSLPPNHVMYEVAILDQSGKGKHVVQKSRTDDGPLVVPYRGIIAGWPKFVKGTKLEKGSRRHIANDTIVVRCGRGIG